MYAVLSITELATVCAVTPSAGVRWMIRRPIVRMIRQPPAYVPALIAAAEANTTQIGTWNEARCPEVTSAAEPICACRKLRFDRCGCALRNPHSSPTIARYASPKPTTGETTIGTTTLSITPDHCTVCEAASAAPTRPPISACEDDEGSPKYQVSRFQAIAPSSAENTTTRPSLPVGVLMIPAPTVAATLVETSAPTTFITAASSSAARGVSALVDTEVAIALAESWNPLV